MRALLAAISFLSVLPVGKFLPTEEDMKKMTDFYPWAGVLFGALFWCVGAAVRHFPPLPAAMLMALLPEVLTKGFHLDGLADTADAFLSGRSRERMLEIMRDSRIGTMGVLGIAALLGLKFACFASLPPELFPAAAAMMMLSGRCAIVWHIATSRYARENGLGGVNFSRIPRWGCCWGIVLPPLAAALLGVRSVPWLAAMLLPVFGAVLWSRLTRRMIGGATGDTIGCWEELAELTTVALFVVAA